MEHTIRLSAVFQNTLGNQPDDVISSNDSLSTIVDHAGIPDVELGADITYSNPDTVTLDAGDFLEYTWNTGALTQTIIVTSTMGEKEYCVTVTDRYGCTDEDCILVLNGIEETGVSYDEISVYPNPSSGLVTLNVVNKNNNDLKVQVIDIHGRLIEEYNYGSVFEITEEIDFTSMAKGLYYIRINNTLDLHQTKIIIR